MLRRCRGKRLELRVLIKCVYIYTHRYLFDLFAEFVLIDLVMPSERRLPSNVKNFALQRKQIRYWSYDIASFRCSEFVGDKEGRNDIRRPVGLLWLCTKNVFRRSTLISLISCTLILSTRLQEKPSVIIPRLFVCFIFVPNTFVQTAA